MDNQNAVDRILVIDHAGNGYSVLRSLRCQPDLWLCVRRRRTMNQYEMKHYVDRLLEENPYANVRMTDVNAIPEDWALPTTHVV